MAGSTANILSGIAAAVAGLAGDKVSKSGSIPGLDLASIIPALLGNKAEGAGGLLGGLASMAGGLLGGGSGSGLGSLAKLAGSLFSASGSTAAPAKSAGAGDGIAGLAAAIMGNSGTGSALGKIASLASGLAGGAKNAKEVTGIATSLGKTLSSNFGLSFEGGGTALKALSGVVEDSTKGNLLQAVLKGLL